MPVSPLEVYRYNGQRNKKRSAIIRHKKQELTSVILPIHPPHTSTDEVAAVSGLSANDSPEDLHPSKLLT